MYLSPGIDCFDGLIVAWKTSRNANTLPTNGVLTEAVKSISAGSHPVLHTGVLTIVG